MKIGVHWRSHERLAVAVRKSSLPAYIHWWLWCRIETWLIPPPPPPSPATKKQSIINHHRHRDRCNNRQHTPCCRRQRRIVAAATATLPLHFPTRCCRHWNHTSAKLPPPSQSWPPPLCCRCRLCSRTATATLPLPRKLKNGILATNLSFTMMVTAACSDNGRPMRQWG